MGGQARVGVLDLSAGLMSLFDPARDSSLDVAASLGSAFGFQAVVEFDGGTALGAGSHAAGQGGTAVGQNASTGAYLSSTAVGSNAVSNGDRATALGSNAMAVGEHATAIGELASADGEDSYASGGGALATGPATTAVGNHANAAAEGSTAIGLQANTVDTFTFAGGVLSRAAGQGSIALGTMAQTNGADLVAIGGNAAFSLSTFEGESAITGIRGSYGVGTGTTVVGAQSRVGFIDPANFPFGPQDETLNHTADFGTAVGSQAVVEGARGTAVGAQAIAGQAGSTARGRRGPDDPRQSGHAGWRWYVGDGGEHRLQHRCAGRAHRCGDGFGRWHNRPRHDDPYEHRLPAVGGYGAS